MGIDYQERIPNNVHLSDDRRLQRALEAWQPNFLKWWGELGPTEFLDFDVYLRTAVSVDAKGWSNFGYVKMPDYRWGIFLAEPEEDRRIGFGEHKGLPAWQEGLFALMERNAVHVSDFFSLPSDNVVEIGRQISI